MNDQFCYWELHEGRCHWSARFMDVLGYGLEDVETHLNYFIYSLLHKESRDTFRDNYFCWLKEDEGFNQMLHILCKNGTYREFRCSTKPQTKLKKRHADSRILLFKEVKLQTNDRVKSNNFYYRETAEMTSTGSWYVDFIKKRTYWDHESRRIFEYPEDYIPSLRNASDYFTDAYYDRSYNLFYQCAMLGKSFDAELKMLTANQRPFWVRTIGKPVYNDHKEIVGIRGVFQDIDDMKLKELGLKRTADIIDSQNKRLFNFAHIVSHNLRSHTSNLSLISHLIEQAESTEEKLELIDTIKDISESLNSTIEHLNDVVTIQTQTDQNKVQVRFQDALDIVLKATISLIVKNNVTIDANFDDVESIEYIPAYLESILLNLVTNAIKYSDKDRTAIVAIKSYISEGRTMLEISDNGVGIDLKKYGAKLFGMYKTFHHNPDAIGIGLFITKNQIESLNGEIFVESEVGQGTTFRIKF